MKTAVLVAFVIEVFKVCLVQAWSFETLPDPMVDPIGCGRGVSGWVCSPDGLVDSSSLSSIQTHINAILAGEEPYSKLFCPARGEDVQVEVMAAVVPSVDGDSADATRVMRFAQDLQHRFDVGTDECGSGAVVAISVEDRQVLFRTIEQSLHFRTMCAAALDACYLLHT